VPIDDLRRVKIDGRLDEHSLAFRSRGTSTATVVGTEERLRMSKRKFDSKESGES